MKEIVFVPRQKLYKKNCIAIVVVAYVDVVEVIVVVVVETVVVLL